MLHDDESPMLEFKEVYWASDSKGNINYKKQLLEIKKSIEYFKKIKVFNKNFSVCYPYGHYNSNTLKLLKKFNVKFALTTVFDSLSKKNINNNFTIPRYDTNHFKL